MDRLLCGDVGFGKTEVALRAVMKAVMDGKQVAILVPTTVLAQQHYTTALRRFSLVMRKCFNAGMRYQDILIYPTSYQLSALDRRFISLLSSARARLSHQAYT